VGNLPFAPNLLIRRELGHTTLFGNLLKEAYTPIESVPAATLSLCGGESQKTRTAQPRNHRLRSSRSSPTKLIAFAAQLLAKLVACTAGESLAYVASFQQLSFFLLLAQ